MPQLSRVQEMARRRIMEVEAERLSPEALGSDILAALDVALPADGWILYGLDHSTLMFNRVLALHSAMDGAGLLIGRYLTQAYLVRQPFPLSPPGLMRASVRATLFHDQIDACWGFPPELADAAPARRWGDFYHEAIAAPAGGTVSACFVADGVPLAWLDVLRAERRRPFSQGDAMFLRRLAPIIGTALRSALIREGAAMQHRTDHDAPGVIILDANDAIRLCTPAAEALVGQLRDAWRPEAPGRPQLPVAVWAAVARHRTHSPESEQRGLVVSTPTGPLRIEASSAGADGSTAVVLSRERRPPPPSAPEGWPLTPAERAVVSQVVRGLSNRSLAQALSIGEHTVEFHLSNIYEKLGVRGRSELVARLFRDTFWPGLHVPNDSADSPSR